MNPVIVMVTVSNRIPLLNAFLQTLAEYGPDWPIHIHIQDPERRAREIKIPLGVSAQVMVTDKPMGCHGARIMSLQDLAGESYDGYLNVDDDVLLTPHTRWAPAMRYAAEEGVGFVLTNWSRTPEMYHAAIPKISHRVEPQIMVYQGGGMAYSRQIADLIVANLEPLHARYDDMWPITSYINGFTNYRYGGSQSVHQTLGKGGMAKYMADEPRPLLGWKYVDYPRLMSTKVGSEYGIPLDKDVRESAKKLHVANRAARGFGQLPNGRDVHPTLPALELSELFTREIRGVNA